MERKKDESFIPFEIQTKLRDEKSDILCSSFLFCTFFCSPFYKPRRLDKKWPLRKEDKKVGAVISWFLGYVSDFILFN